MLASESPVTGTRRRSSSGEPLKREFYSLTYEGVAGVWRSAMIVCDAGTIVGTDAAGCRYDGTYSFDDRTGILDALINVTVRPGVVLVAGARAGDREWSFDFRASFPRETSETPVLVRTPIGQVNVVFRYLRSFPY